MDTNKDSAVAEVPTFKVARVGQERKRKGGFLSFFRKGGAAKPGWNGATGGSGFRAAGGISRGFSGATVSSAGVINTAGASLAKTFLTIFMTAALGSGAVFLGASVGRTGAKPEKKKAFAKEKAPIAIEGDTTNLPSEKTTIPNSLGYVAGRSDGLTDEERAKQAADAEAARAAEDEAARKAEEEAAKNAAAGQPAVDPAALAAAAAADGKPGANFAKKFGSLSTGGSASLSGGAGLSGGVNRNFGSGSTGFKGGKGGTLSGSRAAAKPTMAKAGRSSLAKSNVKGFARSQLVNANALSRRGAGANRAETASYDAASAFDNNQGAGNVITGAGIGNGTKPLGGEDGAPNPGSGNSGGPTGQTSQCSGNAYPDPNTGACVEAKTPKAESANKTLDMLCMIAQGILAVIAIISALALAFASSAIFAEISEILSGVMIALGVVLVGLGVAIMAMGDWAQGTVFTLVGLYIGMSAAAWLFPTLSATGALIGSAAGMILGAAAKFLDAK